MIRRSHLNYGRLVGALLALVGCTDSTPSSQVGSVRSAAPFIERAQLFWEGAERTKVVYSKGGKGLAIDTRGPKEKVSVYVKSFDGQQWSEPRKLLSDLPGLIDFWVFLDDFGNGFLILSQYRYFNDDQRTILTAYRPTSQGWGPGEVIYQGMAGFHSRIELEAGFDGKGNFIVTFVDENASGFYYAKHIPLQGWIPARPVSLPGRFQSPQLIVTAGGAALLAAALFSEKSPSDYSLVVYDYDGADWKGFFKVDLSAVPFELVQLSNGVVVLAASRNNTRNDILLYTLNSLVWSHAQSLCPQGQSCANPRLVVNGQSLFLSWTMQELVKNHRVSLLWGTTKAPGQPWKAPSRIGLFEPGSESHYTTAMNERGTAMIAWRKPLQDKSLDINCNRHGCEQDGPAQVYATQTDTAGNWYIPSKLGNGPADLVTLSAIQPQPVSGAGEVYWMTGGDANTPAGTWRSLLK